MARRSMYRLALDTLRDDDAPFVYIGAGRASTMTEDEIDALLFHKHGVSKLTDVFSRDGAVALMSNPGAGRFVEVAAWFIENDMRFSA